METGGNSSFVKRNMSAPACSSMDQAASSSANDVASSQVQDLLRRMPAQYALATSYADRLVHARLIADLPVGAKPQGDLVRLSWQTVQQDATTAATVWLAFPDRRGSLGLITSLLSELGINIGKASVFSSTDGIAVDTFTVDRSAPHRAAAVS